MVSGSVDTMACHVLIVGGGEDTLTYHLHTLTSNIATYMEMALSLIFTRSYHCVYKICLASNNTR